MQQYNNFWISGSAFPGPPYTNYWTPAGAILVRLDNGSRDGVDGAWLMVQLHGRYADHNRQTVPGSHQNNEVIMVFHL